MTPDTLHYLLVASIFLSLPVLVLAAVLLHLRLRCGSSLSLLVGLVVVLAGQVLQLSSPVEELAYEEFRGIVVTSGRLPISWYAGGLVSSAGLLVVAGGALGIALRLRRSAPASGRAG